MCDPITYVQTSGPYGLEPYTRPTAIQRFMSRWRWSILRKASASLAGMTPDEQEEALSAGDAMAHDLDIITTERNELDRDLHEAREQVEELEGMLVDATTFYDWPEQQDDLNTLRNLIDQQGSRLDEVTPPNRALSFAILKRIAAHISDVFTPNGEQLP